MGHSGWGSGGTPPNPDERNPHPDPGSAELPGDLVRARPLHPEPQRLSPGPGRGPVQACLAVGSRPAPPTCRGTGGDQDPVSIQAGRPWPARHAPNSLPWSPPRPAAHQWGHYGLELPLLRDGRPHPGLLSSLEGRAPAAVQTPQRHSRGVPCPPCGLWAVSLEGGPRSMCRKQVLGCPLTPAGGPCKGVCSPNARTPLSTACEVPRGM